MSDNTPATVPSDGASQPPKPSRQQSTTPTHSSAPHKKPRKARTKQPDPQRRDSSPPAIVDHCASLSLFFHLVVASAPKVLRETLLSSPARISNVREQSSAETSPRFEHLPHYTVHGQSYILHPGYSMNGHPYQSSPSPFHQPPSSGSPHNGQGSHMGPGIPGAAYPYPVHHPGYGPHGYPSYPSYPAPPNVVMYGPGPSHAEHPPSQPQAEPSTPPTPAPTTGKRKSKYTSVHRRGIFSLRLTIHFLAQIPPETRPAEAQRALLDSQTVKNGQRLSVLAIAVEVEKSGSCCTLRFPRQTDTRSAFPLVPSVCYTE